MKKAFIILAHQLPQQLNSFITQLLSLGDSEVFIHINKLNDTIKEEIIVDSNVHISEKNISIYWGSDSILRALIIMMNEVKAFSGQFDYVFLCSGQDLLVRQGLDEFLEEHYGEVFIDGYKEDKRERAFLLYTWPNKYKKLIDSKINPLKLIRRLRIELLKTGIPIAKKKINYDVNSLVFYRNWFWCCLPYEILEYILNFLDKNPNFWSIYENALVPEEGFFSTIIMNSKYSDRIHYHGGRSRSLTYDGPRNNGHSQVITKDFIDDIKLSGRFFARKFDYRIDKEVVDYYCKDYDWVNR